MSKISFDDNDLQALQHWIAETRETAPLLNNEADGLSLRLSLLQHRLDTLHMMTQVPPLLALYGYDRSEKSQLLKLLLGDDSGKITFSFGQKRLDYLEHINPDHSEPAIAVRFSSRYPVRHEDYPLTLRLFSESDLVQLFIQYYHASPDARPADGQALSERLLQRASHNQLAEQTAITAEQVATIIEYYQQLADSRYPQINDETGYQLTQLIPQMGLNDRAHCFSLLWGDNQIITRQWLQLVSALHKLKQASYVIAPLSLLVDRYLLPMEGFLIATENPSEDEMTTVTVCSLIADELSSPVTLPLHQLALLTTELILPLTDSSKLSEYELIDLPENSSHNALNITQSKTRFITRICHPDMMLICQATSEDREVIPVARRLYQQHVHSPVKMIWPISLSSSDRFYLVKNREDWLRTLLNTREIPCDTVTVTDQQSIQNLLSLLTRSASADQRLQYVVEEATAIRQIVCQLFSGYIAPFSDSNQPVQECEKIVRILQKQAARQGELLEDLLPPEAAIHQVCQRYAKHHHTTQQIFSPDINLLDEEEVADRQKSPQGKDSSLAILLHRLWINHLRYRTCQENTFSAQLLPLTLRIALCNTLITASYRLSLTDRLARALHNEHNPSLSAISAINVFNSFITWLGYTGQPEAQRPASRWNKGRQLFSQADYQTQDDSRLQRLSTTPQHAATAYVYDWLTGLLALSQENKGFQDEGNISKPAWIKLTSLLADGK